MSLSDNYKATIRFAFEWQRNAEWNSPVYSNPNVTFWYVLDGARSLIVNGQAYELKAGDLVVIPPNAAFTTHWSRGRCMPFHYLSACIAVYVHGIEWSELYGLPKLCRSTLESQAAELTESWQELVYSWKRTKAAIDTDNIRDSLSIRQVTAQLKMQAVCLSWLSHLMAWMEPHMVTTDPVIDERVRRVCAYIRGAYASPIRLSDMAGVVNTSEGHLRLLFRNSMNISPYRFLLRVRIEKAEELLLATEASLADIAGDVGFEDYSHFKATFRRLVGVSPSVYRKTNRMYE
ncbi:AraC family transcriptional regulator [Paenibacillus sp. PAMC21692]|uniref:AraC family transcriptional regulator n=1 Tax=Paenibacillus sp. PAMC21692 TaxID=2762320 RepID=UPI00164EA400|nr:AraC family transcriptional regulator [Paenibacillus sp. PAMC21692]QNK57900.1 AraC family transcriptional regulator [Paenibacillus sp. PAMC21692]